MSITVNTKDEIIMRLVHYFVTEENYQPIIINGVKNEIWLENLEAQYRIIRINSNYIHNKDQLIFDNYKVKSIAKQVKKKTLSFKVNILNILLDLNEEINIQNDKNIDTFKIKTLKDVRNDNGISKLFPKLKTFTLSKENNVELIVNITNDINKKTEKNNITYDNIFKPKKIIVTKILIIINVIMFIFSTMYPNVFNLFFLNSDLVKMGEYWRLFTAAFLHANVFHLLVNMYSLHIIGTQVETFLGKRKFLIVYFGSAIVASLMSAVITQGNSVGASGALFGLLGCLLYFGYHYRIYFGSVLTSQIVPVILINLLIGFTIPMIDNAAHIGGLIGGLFITMAIGIGKKDKTTMINGIIVSFIYIAFLTYLLFLN
ncbi:MAG: rhomboid family intramembrane serine protease [Bacilli bacterium]|nr:rhomboid family intramembrane serine protease [Bacilli bacterium]MDD4406440.1 rhomboid family intramembrane serine protease [Bacilli bacterium]